jgi:hypothetical protein
MQASGRRRHPGRHHRSSGVVRVDRLTKSRRGFPPKHALPPRYGRDRIPDGAEGQANRHVLRPHVVSGVAIMAASVIAVAPIAPHPPEIYFANPEVRLAVASPSIANIPTNLIYAIANVPHSEVQALDELAKSLLFTGNWWVGSATNIWGTDPADPGHWQAVTDLLVPFPAMSGPAGDQLAMWWATQYVVNAACDAVTCPPVVPLQPITGITALDKTIWAGAILLGYPFPLLAGMFKVGPLALLSGYTFGDVVDNSGPVFSYFGFEGTHPGPNGEPLMPWSGTTFTLNPLAGWQNFFTSLMAPPPSPADGIHLASGLDLSRALAAVLAGLVVDFNPFEKGSAFCLGECALPEALTTVGIVKSILALSPGNPVITEWLARVADGTANGPTQAQRDFLAQELAGDLGVFKFNPDTTAALNAGLRSINPVLPDIAFHSGLLGGLNAPALVADIARLLGFSTVSSATASVAPATAAMLSAPESQTVAAQDRQSLNAENTPIAQPDTMTLSGTRSQKATADDGKPLNAKNTPVAQPDSVTLSGRESQTMPSQVGGEVDTIPSAIEVAWPTTATSTNQTRDSNKVEPGIPGVNDTPRAGLAGATKAVLSKVRDALKGGNTDSDSAGNSDSTGSPGRHRAK